jgi:hypothetical protein
MRTLTVIGLSAILAAGAGLSPGNALAQQKSLKEQLVGTWILVSCDQSRDGRTLPTCINGSGSLNFDASGRYTAVRAVRGRPKLSAGIDSPADELKAAVQGSGFNFGTWSANDADKIITRHIEGALIPNNEGTDTKDTAIVAGDELRLVDADPNPLARCVRLAPGKVTSRITTFVRPRLASAWWGLLACPARHLLGCGPSGDPQ